MEDKELEGMGCLFALLWFPLLVVASSLYHGYVLTKLWLWFMVPTFGLPLLSLPAAIGLSLIVSFMAKTTSSSSKKEESVWDIMGKSTLNAAMIPTLSLLMGWIVKHWM